MERVNTHNNFFYFTVALVILLVVSGVVASTPDGESHQLLQLIMFMVELVAYFSLNLSRRWRHFVVLMLVLTLLSNVLRHLTGSQELHIAGLFVILVFFSGMAYAAAKQVLFTGNIELNTIVGTMAVYLLLGLVWAVLYLIALEFWPAGFNGIDYKDWNDNMGVMVYFSYVTMTTLGYGDISPALPVTRALAYLQALTGSFYMAVVVASLVGAHGKSSK